MEKRKSNRFNALNEMKGKLYNVVNFLVKNLSKEGLNLTRFLKNKSANPEQGFIAKDNIKEHT